jgi:hypothetical protein
MTWLWGIWCWITSTKGSTTHAIENKAELTTNSHEIRLKGSTLPSRGASFFAPALGTIQQKDNSAPNQASWHGVSIYIVNVKGGIMHVCEPKCMN